MKTAPRQTPPGSPSDAKGQMPGTPTTASTPPSAGVMPLRRLTRDELSYTVEDLLGDTSRPGLKLPEEAPGPSGFSTPGGLSSLEFRRFMEMSEELADSATKSLDKLLPCDPAKVGEDKCVASFIETFGRRAFRRKVTAAEATLLQQLFTKGRTEFKYDLKGAVGLVLQAILQSPNFLYRWELGSQTPLREGSLIKLNGDEVAARLSYLLWSSLPDDALFRAADEGRLATAEGVEAQARRMLKDPKARRSLSNFHAQWLQLTGLADLPKDMSVYPAFTTGVRKAMEDELGTFVGDLFQTGDGKLGTLLSAPYSFVNGALAPIYGLTGTGSDLARRDLDASKRAGILTQAAFLSRHASPYGSHPVKRGKMVLEKVLCSEVPPPPGNIPQPKAPAPDLSTRDRFAEHSSNPGCAGCHKFLDPLGFAFENYDGIGQYRSTEGGKPVNATGVVALADGERPFKNAVELAQILASSDDVRRCLTAQWARYGLGRAEGPDDKPGIDAAYGAFGKTGWDLRELVIALARSGAFLYRRPAAGEVF